MPLLEEFTSQLPGIISTGLVVISPKVIDIILQRTLDREFFGPLWSKAKKKWKAFKTRRDKISADFEFSIYVGGNRSLANTVSDYERVIQNLTTESEDIVTSPHDIKWNRQETEGQIDIRFRENTEAYSLKCNFIEDSSALGSEGVETPSDAPISSIGITVTFSFAFANLRSAIIDLVAFAGFIQSAFEQVYSVREVTNGRFIVSPVGGDLTMEDWVHDQQFDVSLLLKSDDSQRSVRFHGNRAEITSPTRQIDDETVEYIRATLLNYYL